MRGLKLFHNGNLGKWGLCSPLSFSHILFTAILIHYLAKPLYFSAKPYTIWRNYRLLPNCIGFCQIVWGFCQKVSLLPNRMRFCQKVSLTPNCIRLSPNRLYFWQKNPRTKVRTLSNVKTPLKTQENNVSFRSM